MGSLCRQVVRVWPKIGDSRNPIVVIQLEETEARLPGAVRVGEINPARCAPMLTNNPNDVQMPISWEALDVEPHVSGTPSDPFASLRSLINDVFGEKVTEGIPVSVIRGHPVRGNHVPRRTHSLSLVRKEQLSGSKRQGDNKSCRQDLDVAGSAPCAPRLTLVCERASGAGHRRCSRALPTR
jgi:hypothetical protein